MISKELLSEVLNKNVDQIIIDSKVIENNLSGGRSTADIAYRINYDWFYINIHELAHKCKELALKQEYYLHSHIKEDNDCWCIVKSLDNITRQLTFNEETEPEAIFKATQYIYDNLRN